jgi:hypothetical protein
MKGKKNKYILLKKNRKNLFQLYRSAEKYFGASLYKCEKTN